MKETSTKLFAIGKRYLFLVILASISCRDDHSPLLNGQGIPVIPAMLGSDNTVYNYENLGNVVYTQAKYYSQSIDPYNFLPPQTREPFKDSLSSLIRKTSAWSPDQITDYLVSNGTYTTDQGTIIKNERQNIASFIAEQPSSRDLMAWFETREKGIADNTSISSTERQEVLSQLSLVKHSLKLRIEQYELNASQRTPDARIEDDCSFWSVLACWVGQLSSGAGLGNSVGELVATTGGGEVGAAIGIAISIATAVETCQCNVNKNVCQAPLSVSFPYRCYTYGTDLNCKAVAYGNTTPTQFSFGFYPNDNTAYINELVQIPSVSNNVNIPGKYMTASVNDLAVQVSALCNGTWLASQYFGYYYPSDLGKPFFTITGNSNISLSQTGWGWNYNYQTVGPLWDSNAVITWQLVPSGYLNYSATGTIVSGNTNPAVGVTVRWDSKPGFATLKCTAVTSCSTIVQYYYVHIQ